MNINKCLDQARAMAEKAKPFILKHDGRTYTAVFSQSQWVYEVYEDGIFMLNINMKSPSKAKKFLQHYLTH